MDKFLAEMKWLAFQAQYCLGGNFFESRICREFSPWALAVAAVLALLVFVTLWHLLAKPGRAWLWRRAQAKVADRATMDRVRWTGDDAAPR